ncbi:hypothetical protein CBR_g2935 [Chara braunii]|uniref:Uncharacterized protein n=1 Tax=Chara braunii TaxID=69332 RepID=A0A388KEA5_CHABU|nr:hypothetical protein CBR_g2935 [Chara braunii]|eukprot:GBG68392.1 hypothetical protein CBR_g2935 [Chara braunii]
MRVQVWFLPLSSQLSGKLRLEVDDHRIETTIALEEVRVWVQKLKPEKLTATLLRDADQFRVEPLLQGWTNDSQFVPLIHYKPRVGVQVQLRGRKKSAESVALKRANKLQLTGATGPGLRALWKPLTKTLEEKTLRKDPGLLIIQGWRTNAQGDLIGFLFGSVRPGRRQLIAQELIAPIVQLADDFSPDIYFQSDNSSAPYIFERSLDPYLQWTSCLEEPRDEDTLPSRQEYLKPYEIIPYAFYPKAEEVVIDGDEEEEDNDEETSEEGSYSEHSEGELSEKEEEEEGTGSEWEAPPEEETRTGTEAEDPEAA